MSIATEERQERSGAVRSIATKVGLIAAGMALAVGTGLALIPSASAVTTDLSTGTGAAATDPVWTLVSDPAGPVNAPATIVTTVPVVWTADIPTTKWISKSAAPDVAAPLGTYVFEASGSAAAAGMLSGSITADTSVQMDLVQGATTTLVNTFATGPATVNTVTSTPVAVGAYKVRLTLNRTTAGPAGVRAKLSVADVVVPPATTSPATVFHALAQPVRVYDSRSGTGPAANNDGRLAFGAVRAVSLADGYATSTATTKTPAVPAGAKSALVNLTVDATLASGFVSLNSSAATDPASSNINWFGDGQILANNNVVAVGPDGKIKMQAGGPGSAHVILDVIGYFTVPA